jgi:DNA sulfur modification protein DndE
MYVEEGENFSIKNLTLLTRDANPVFTIINGKEMTFDNVRYKNGAELLMSLAGSATKNIRLVNTDSSNAKRELLSATEVPAAAFVKN